MLLMLSAVLVCGLLLSHSFQEGKLWFNMPSKSRYPVRGVDASHYQGQMNWERIAEQGVTFAFLEVQILPAIALIGVTTFAFSAAGVKIGNVFGIRFKSKAELAGGVILILLGIKILVEHLFFAG